MVALTEIELLPLLVPGYFYEKHAMQHIDIYVCEARLSAALTLIAPDVIGDDNILESCSVR